MISPYKKASKLHISQGYHEGHQALDFAPYNGYGTWLVAPEDVVVESIVDSLVVSESLEPLARGYGIQMMDRNELHYVYWHCLPLFPVHVGEIIGKGKPVAQMGNSGNVFAGGVYVPPDKRMDKAGTHLHLEVFRMVGGKRVYEEPNITWEEPNYTWFDQVNAMIKVLRNKITYVNQNK
jgi:hypothetical protein